MASDGRIYDPKILIPGGSGVSVGSLWAQTTHSTDTAEPPMVGAFDLIEDLT